MPITRSSKVAVSVILPCFNEKENILALIDAIHLQVGEYVHEIIVVDDNSPDGTYNLVAHLNYPFVKVFQRTASPSLAKSIRYGIEKSIGNIIVVMDSDFNHKPEYLPIMIENIKYYDLVSASRFVYGGDMRNRFRHLSSWVFNIFTRIMTRTFITDCLFGYFAVKRDVLERVDFNKVFWGYGDYCIRMMYYLQKDKITILQIPGVLGERLGGQGNTKIFKTLMLYTIEVIKLVFFTNKKEWEIMTYTQIQSCRVCGNTNLVEVLNLGIQTLTGVFPLSRDQIVTAGPLILVKCHGEGNICHLLQLKHTYNLEELYGENYGYRSGLNNSMVAHLESKVSNILQKISLSAHDLIIDIGSNDGTTLGFYPQGDWDLVGIDPTGKKFSEYYKNHIKLIPNFFSHEKVSEYFGERKAKVVTSFSMFYDLEDPVKFAMEVAAVLAHDGIWVLEQSYMPTMLEKNSYDTVCHEHLEYYGLTQIEWIVNAAGLRILDVAFNDINGGSFSVAISLNNSCYNSETFKINEILGNEEIFKSLKVYRDFEGRVLASKNRLLQRLNNIKAEGGVVYGVGASTKGNVILQYCGIDENLLPLIGEVNKDKFGKYTPGSVIKIISEEELVDKNPDYLLVLPWHFKKFFENSELFRHIQLIYPL